MPRRNNALTTHSDRDDQIQQISVVEIMKCIRTGCNNSAVWLVGSQYSLCDDHVDDAMEELYEHVGTTIRKEPIEDNPQEK
jgi:hypothetical protein